MNVVGILVCGVDLTCCCVPQETVFKEQVEGLVEEDDGSDAAEAANEQDHGAAGAITLSEKKTERQRKKEKAEKLKVNGFVFQFFANVVSDVLPDPTFPTVPC